MISKLEFLKLTYFVNYENIGFYKKIDKKVEILLENDPFLTKQDALEIIEKYKDEHKVSDKNLAFRMLPYKRAGRNTSECLKMFNPIASDSRIIYCLRKMTALINSLSVDDIRCFAYQGRGYYGS